MALPDLNSPTKVEGKNVIVASVPTSASGVLANASGSSKTLRLSSIYASNIDGTNDANVTSYIVDNTVSASGYLAKDISVPAKATLLPLTKEANIYLDENQTLYVQASAADDICVIVNYEEIS